MARLMSIAAVATALGCHPRTPTNWVAQRFITPYRRTGSAEILLDLDEIEQAFIDHPQQMRDPRKRYGGAPVVVLPAAPVRAEVVGEADR